MVLQKQVSITEYLDAWKKSREDFLKLPKDEQKKIAVRNLINTGVLNSDGTPKKVICTID